jgi:hypothetical protein
MVEGAGADAGQDQPPGMPRWVKLMGIALVVLVVAMVVAMLVLGGDHGPGRHF